MFICLGMLRLIGSDNRHKPIFLRPNINQQIAQPSCKYAVFLAMFLLMKNCSKKASQAISRALKLQPKSLALGPGTIEGHEIVTRNEISQGLDFRDCKQQLGRHQQVRGTCQSKGAAGKCEDARGASYPRACRMSSVQD